MGQNANIKRRVRHCLDRHPTGVKVYDWMLTMFRGRIRLTVPWCMPWVSSCIRAQRHQRHFARQPTIIAGPGVISGRPFHNVAVPGVLFGMLSAYHFWFPKAFRERALEGLGPVLDLWLHGRVLPAVRAGPHGLAAAQRSLTDTYGAAGWVAFGRC
jgi:cytochrome o ubiquinol oxidase subunit 1